jgi:uncharacterized protein YegJ (DUF2314 family)
MTLKRLSRLSGGHLGPCAAGGRLVSDTTPIKVVTAQPVRLTAWRAGIDGSERPASHQHQNTTVLKMHWHATDYQLAEHLKVDNLNYVKSKIILRSEGRDRSTNRYLST